MGTKYFTSETQFSLFAVTPIFLHSNIVIIWKEERMRRRKDVPRVKKRKEDRWRYA